MINAFGNYIGFGAQERNAFNTPFFSSYIDGNYQVVKFSYVSGSTIPNNGIGNFYLGESKEIEYLIIAGGAAGGFGTEPGGRCPSAGGGAGQLLSGSFQYLANQKFNFVVGAGGIGYITGSQGLLRGNSGTNSSLSGTSATGLLNFVALGGGGGGTFARNGGSPAPNATGCPGGDGGSGGGGGWSGFDNFSSAFPPGSGSIPGGNNGGSGSIVPASFDGGSGGGGGATTTGSAAFNIAGTFYGGNGGSGSLSSISGSARYYAGGGAGSAFNFPGTQNNGTGGVGGGGTLNISGEDQTGSGGGPNANGATGTIIIRWNINQQNLY